MRVIQLAVGGFDHNFSYIVTAGNGESAVIDPTGDRNVLFPALAAIPKCQVRHILVTHGHADHIGLLAELAAAHPEAEISGHPGNRYVTRKLADGETLELGESRITALYTPGHSRDAVCYLADDEALFTGDTLFMDYVGFARHPESLYSSLKRISKLNGNITLYPGHDYGGVSCRTLAEEKRANPYLNCRDIEDFKNQLKDMD